MAEYDSGVTWDSGARWDAVDPVNQHQPNKRMAQVKLDLRSKTDATLIVFAGGHQTGIANNAIFINPTPDTPTLTALLADFESTVGNVATTESAAREAVVLKDAARDLIENALNQRSNYVETISDGDAATILSAGFQVRSASTAIGDLPAPVDFLATMGDMIGEIDLIWSPVKGANAYMIQYREHGTTAPWTTAIPTTASKATIPGLDPGKTYAFQVAALGAAGQGPWSDESVKMAP